MGGATGLTSDAAEGTLAGAFGAVGVALGLATEGGVDEEAPAAQGAGAARAARCFCLTAACCERSFLKAL